MQELGRSLDRIGTTQQQRGIRNLRSEINQLAVTSRSSSRDVDRLVREIDRLAQASNNANRNRLRGGGGWRWRGRRGR